MLFNKEDRILINSLYLLKGHTAQNLLKVFQNQSWNDLPIGGCQCGSCWWPCEKSWRCATDKSVGTWNFKDYWNSTVVTWSYHPWSFQSHSQRGK